MLKTFKTGETDQCPCGNANQTAPNILRSISLYVHLSLGTKIWPNPTLETQKLYGCLGGLS